MTKPSEELLIESGKTQRGGESITEMMRRMLAMIGEDPNREGLRKTPERFEKARREGGPLHGIQSWVALPDEDEETAPSFAHHEGDGLPVHQDRGLWLRLLAGEAFGLRSAVRAHSALFYVHAALQPGARVELPRQYAERAVYLVSGAVEAGGRVIDPLRMAVFADGAETVIEALAPSILMLLGGDPVGERFIEWNFVSSSRQRIEQAKADWRAGRMKLPDLDNAEFIPLPPDPAPSPRIR